MMAMSEPEPPQTPNFQHVALSDEQRRRLDGIVRTIVDCADDCLRRVDTRDQLAIIRIDETMLLKPLADGEHLDGDVEVYPINRQSFLDALAPQDVLRQEILTIESNSAQPLVVWVEGPASMRIVACPVWRKAMGDG